MLAGDHRSSLLGRGTELAQVRPYVPGDDVRLIDWNVTARTTEPHVRVHLAERVLVTWIVLDMSPSMTFGTATRRKADVALGVTLAVGHAATIRGNRVGTRRLRRRDRAGAPADAGAGGARRPAASRCATATSRTAQRGWPSRRRSRRVAGAARQRALVVVVSDFRGPRDWRKAVLRLAGRHQVVAMEIRDPREQALEPVGTLWLVDPESGARAPGRHERRHAAHPVRRGGDRRAGAVARELASAGRRPRRALDRRRLAARARDLPAEASQVTFVWPLALVGLAAIPVLAVLYVLAGRRRRRDAARFANPALVPNLVSSSPGWRRHVAPVLALAALALLVDRRRATARGAQRHARRRDDRARDRHLALDGGGRRPADALPGGEARPRSRSSTRCPTTTAWASSPSRRRRTRCCRRRSTARRRRRRSPSSGSGSGTAIGNAITRSVDLALDQRPGQRPRPRPGRSGRLPPCSFSPTARRRQATSARSPRRSAPAASACPSRRWRSARATRSSRCRGRAGSRSAWSSRRTCRRSASSRRRPADRSPRRPDAASLESVYRELGTRLARDRKRVEVTSAFAAGRRRADAPRQHALVALVPEGAVTPASRDRRESRRLVDRPRRRRERRSAADECKGLQTCLPGHRPLGRDPRPGARRRVDRRLADALPAARLHRRRDRRARLGSRDRHQHPRRERRSRLAGRDDRPRGRVHRASTPAARRARPRSSRSSAASRPRAAGAAARRQCAGPAAFAPVKALDRRVVRKRLVSGRDGQGRRRLPRGDAAPRHEPRLRVPHRGRAGPHAPPRGDRPSRRHGAARRRDGHGRADACRQSLAGRAPAPQPLLAGNEMSFEAPALLVTLLAGAAGRRGLLAPAAAAAAVRGALHEPRGARGRRGPSPRLAPARPGRAAARGARVALRRVRPADGDRQGAERARERRARGRHLRLDARDRREADATRCGQARDAVVPRARADARLRVGIVSFSDEAQVIVPPTVDRKQLDTGDRRARPGVRDGARRRDRARRRARPRCGSAGPATAAPRPRRR